MDQLADLEPTASASSVGLGKTRIDALSDGVFAVALTLLVLELHPPHLAEPGWWDALWPKVASVVASFLIAGIYWMAHNNETRLIKNTTRPLLWLNLLFLLSVVFIPFSTTFLGMYWAQDSEPWQARASILVYGANLVVTGLLLQANWSYAVAKGWLVDWLTEPENEYQIGRTTVRNMFMPLLCIAAMALSFWSNAVGRMLLVAAPLAYVAMTLLQKSPGKRPSKSSPAKP